jgi:hypothetical protein
MVHQSELMKHLKHGDEADQEMKKMRQSSDTHTYQVAATQDAMVNK